MPSANFIEIESDPALDADRGQRLRRFTDGNAVRGAFERGRRATPLHMVNVWAVETRICLAQSKAPNRNESAGAMEVLAAQDLDGYVRGMNFRL